MHVKWVTQLQAVFLFRNLFGLLFPYFANDFYFFFFGFVYPLCFDQKFTYFALKALEFNLDC